MAERAENDQSVSLAIVGSGGAGAMTTGAMLLDAAVRSGWYGVMTRSVGPQIRGGEAAALIRLSAKPVESHDDFFDLLFALDWKNYASLAAEIPLRKNSLVISDVDGGECPVEVSSVGGDIDSAPMKELLSKIPGGRINMVALGAVAKLVGIPIEAVIETVDRHLGSKGPKVVEASSLAIHKGAEAVNGITFSPRLGTPPKPPGERWLVTGNEATGLGAVRGGVRFVAAYPITPATDISEWMAPALAGLGGTLVQAEDELASVNMIIGASFGGVPSMTATSGPGLGLMSEAIGLAVIAEIPIVVVDVMRCGPSTGIATKSEQSDLNIAAYGLHGDAPHVVVAPNSIADCAETCQWAVQLAEALQTPAIVLSDQSLGQSQAVINRLSGVGEAADRAIYVGDGDDYKRYTDTESGISPMALPGTPGGEHASESLTHSDRGYPSTSAENHIAQIDKRARKLQQFDFGERWADIEGDGDLAIITWGSCCNPVREALQRRTNDDVPIRFISLRLIAPAQPAQMIEALKGIRRVLVIEQSHSGQLAHFLRAHYDLPPDTQSFRRAGPLPFLPHEICETITRWQQ